MAAGMSLRAWLRKTPQPSRIRIRTEDDETRFIALTEATRNRWGAAEEAVLAARAVEVECLDAKDQVLRGQKLDLEPDEDDGPGGDQERIRLDKAISRERRDIAGIVDAVMRNQNDSFERGASAAAVGQESLLSLVSTLTENLTNAITNLHNVSVNLANFIAAAGETTPDGQQTNMQLLGQVLALASAKQQAQAAQPPPNGKGGRSG